MGLDGALADEELAGDLGIGLAAGQQDQHLVSASLLARLTRLARAPARPASRLALADALLAVITAGMLVSGFWDWFAGHPTRIRWHAITGIVLAILLLVHTVRRWSRLRRSDVR